MWPFHLSQDLQRWDPGTHVQNAAAVGALDRRSDSGGGRCDSTTTGDICSITLSEYLCLIDYHYQSMPTWFALHPSWYLSHPTSNLRFHLGFAFASHWILWVYTLPANTPFLKRPIKLSYSGPIVNPCQPPAIPVTHAGAGPRKAELCFGLAASVAHFFRPLLVALSNPFLVQRASVTGEGVKRWCWPIANEMKNPPIK